MCGIYARRPSFAKDPPPFAQVSLSIDGAAKRRTVPEFSLVERAGKKVTLADLRGKIWIADFIYRRCTDACPLQTADMAKLQDRWSTENEVELVSFSVDPENDTPRVPRITPGDSKQIQNAGCS